MLKPSIAALILAAAAPAAASGAEPIPCEAVASIGAAHMDEDGVITLRIRSLPPGPIAEAELRYAPNDPHYEDIKRHLGGIAPGETKPVKPWC